MSITQSCRTAFLANAVTAVSMIISMDGILINMRVKRTTVQHAPTIPNLVWMVTTANCALLGQNLLMISWTWDALLANQAISKQRLAWKSVRDVKETERQGLGRKFANSLFSRLWFEDFDFQQELKYMMFPADVDSNFKIFRSIVNWLLIDRSLIVRKLFGSTARFSECLARKTRGQGE